MSQKDQNIPNGLLPQNSLVKPQVPLQNAIHRPLNGFDSSHSSRDSSPSTRIGGIPASQLPPRIPPNQLPPNFSNNFGQLNINQSTPNASQKPQTFSTSTPTMSNASFPESARSSPIVPQKVQNVNTSVPQVNVPESVRSLPNVSQSGVFQKTQSFNAPVQQQSLPNTSQVSFTHSTSSHFTNVPLNLPNNNATVQQQNVQQKPIYAQSNFNQNQPFNATPVNNNSGPNYTKMSNGQNAPTPNLQFNTNLQRNPAFTTQSQNIAPTMSQPQLRPPIGVPNAMGPSLTQMNTQQRNAMHPQPVQPPIASFPQGNVPHQGLKANLHTNRYPSQMNTLQQQNYQSQPQMQQISPQNQFYGQNQPQTQQPSLQNQQYYSQSPYQQSYERPNVAKSGFNKLWGMESFDLLQTPSVLPPTKLEPPKVSLGQDFLDEANCSPEVFRCTMTKIPETNSLLQKSRLPLGVLIHPFKDLNHLPVIQCNVIVRCRACRTYINPFVFFVDSKRWKCNLCYRVNELPEEFQYDPVSKTYGDPSRRPEIKSSTIEYIAPAEYMLRPPQPAVYLYLFDVSRMAVESGYLHTICGILSAELANIPGDTRTQIGFLTYDSALHFYFLGEGSNQPHEMTVLDIDDVFLPCPDNLLVNLKDRFELVSDLLTQLPTRYNGTFETNSALGAALQAAHKLMSATGGRVTVFQASLPTVGPGALTAREDPSQRAGAEAQHLNPATDFYKRLALECSSQQIAVDLFIVNSQYVDIATISGISRFSGGCIYHFPLFKASRVLQNESLERTFRRYILRKIGFEAVMRIRCSRGLSIHSFHGNFFVRSTDLLSLPNVNPDAGFGMQIVIEENLSDLQTVCFQAALLYTSSKGERRIRVHTLCVPVANTLTEIINSADQQCIIGLLAKMAVDRSMQSSLSDAKEALVNAAVDVLSAYKMSLNLGTGMSGLTAPGCLRLLPLYISALMKFIAFRTGTSTRLDDRVKMMCDMKTKPLYQLIQMIYPDLYPIHNLDQQGTVLNDEDEPVPIPPHLQLTSRNIDGNGAYLMDTGEHMILLICPGVSSIFLNEALDVADYNSISEEMYELPILENAHNRRLNCFINYLNDEKPFIATLQVIKDTSPNRNVFYERLIEDRVESALSYHEFLQHLKTQVK